MVLPHLQSDSYNLRSAIVTAIGRVLVHCSKEENNENDGVNGGNDTQQDFALNFDEGAEDTTDSKSKQAQDKRNELLDILTERSHDVSSFTRGTVLKTWATLIESQSLPVKRLIPVTALAIDRLQDKTVIVRKNAMQVRYFIVNKHNRHALAKENLES